MTFRNNNLGVVPILMYLVIFQAQGKGQDTWSKTFGGASEDKAKSIVCTYDQNYVIGGNSQSFSDGGQNEAYILKINPSGVLLWSHNIQTLRVLNKLIETNDSCLAIVGTAYSEQNESLDCVLMKLTAAGVPLWSYMYGSSEREQAYGLTQTSDNGYLICGQTGPVDNWATDNNLYLVKINASGQEEWSKTYGGPNSDAGISVIETFDNAYLTVGYTYNYGTTGLDTWLVKTDFNGDTLWTKTYRDDNFTSGTTIIETTDHEYLLSDLNNKTVMKINSDGDMIWLEDYGNSTSDIVETLDNNYLFVGSKWMGNGTGYDDLWIAKADQQGYLSWEKTYGGELYEGAYSAIQSVDGGYMVAGYTYSFGAGQSDIWVLKTDMNGDIDETNSITSVPAQPLSMAILKVYPNPFNAQTTIQYTIGKTADLTINIFNLAGELLVNRTFTNHTSGKHQFLWNGTNSSGQILPSGVYIVQFTSNFLIESRKVVLLK